MNIFNMDDVASLKEPRDVLIYYALIHHGDWEKIYSAMKSRGPLPPSDVVNRVVQNYRNRTVTILDDNYPSWLAKIIRPPFVIFYQGNFSLLSDPDRILAISGSPDTDDGYPSGKTREIAKEMAKKGFIVVSGLSRGIQQIALESALSCGPAIAVLANGMKAVYPAEAKDLQTRVGQKGLVISQFADSEPASAEKMRARNAFLGQAGKILFVPSCRPQDGILISIALALREGRDVGCLPCRANDPNLNNQLIREGAALVESAEDLVFEMSSSGRGDS